MVHHFRYKIFIFILLILAGKCAAQNRNIPLSDPVNVELLKYHEDKAKEFVAKNLNRFAYERLQKYDLLLDSLYTIEKRDTLAKIEKSYQESSASKISSINKLNKGISEKSILKDELQKRYWSLVKKAVFSFALWITIVLILLQFRKNRLRKINSKLQTTNIQLQTLESSIKVAEKLIANLKELKDPVHKLSSEFTTLNTLFTEAGSKPNAPSTWPEIVTKTNNLSKSIESEDKILTAILLQKENASEEKSLTDINSLCEQYVEIASRGFLFNSEMNCQVVKDFEKKLSPIKVDPVSVGSLLLNVLTNAFQSVKIQSSKGIKGYQPKVTISTRILPRFLQIRIRDNGTGMKEDVLKSAAEEFFTTRPFAEGSGLGLYVANNIVHELHKGEIKIESEDGASTDVYIKFFI